MKRNMSDYELIMIPLKVISIVVAVVVPILVVALT